MDKEFNMKKQSGFTGLIVLAAVIAVFLISCGGEKGGTIVVVNRHSVSVIVTVNRLLNYITTGDSIPAGGSKSYAVDQNGAYTVKTLGNESKNVSVSGGEIVTVTFP